VLSLVGGPGGRQSCRRHGRHRSRQHKSAKASKDARQTRLASPAVRKAKRPARKDVVRATPLLPSIGQLTGLHATEDALDLKSSVALVVDQDTNEVLFSKNPTPCCRSRRSPS